MIWSEGMKLKFQPNSESYDSGRRAVTFEALDGVSSVLCQVSEDALRDKVDNAARTKEAFITAFRSRRFSAGTGPIRSGANACF